MQKQWETISKLQVLLLILVCVALSVTVLLSQRLTVKSLAERLRHAGVELEASKSTTNEGGRCCTNIGTNDTEGSTQTTQATEASFQEECQTQRLSNQATPRVRLDPDKLLYPVLLWGPNNQLEGLRESIYVAIKLNRTLVVPHFFPQHNDRSGQRIHLVTAANRIDLEKLSKFMSVMSIEDMQKHCNHSFDIAFQNRPRWCEAVKEAQLDTGMEILNVTKIDGYNGTFTMTTKGSQCWQPRISALPETVTHGTKHNINRLREIFNTTARCAVFLFPFLSLSLSAMAGYRPVEYSMEEDIVKQTTTENIHEAPIPLLVAAVEHATDRPPYIKQIVDRFHREVVQATHYVAVHWRFDKEMMKSLCNQKSAFCHEDPTPLEVARGIAVVQSQVAESHNTAIPVYIAAPPTVNALIAKVKYYLENPLAMWNKTLNVNNTNTTNDAAQVFTAAQLTPFIDRFYSPKSCPNIRPTPNELLSLLEMEIAQRSRAFLFSSGSTWSAMVLRLRPPKLYPFDKSTMHIIIGQRKEGRRKK